MYSTIDGAKKCAKTVRRLLDKSGIEYPLNKCQAAVAIAGGFEDWHNMNVALGKTVLQVKPEKFRPRLLAALPVPCRPVIIDWLDGEPVPPAQPAVDSRRWFQYVFPYVIASAALHRGNTPLLRTGSGPGLKLRQDIVFELVLGGRRGRIPDARLDPETLALIYEGSLEELFGEIVRHSQFQAEVAKLSEAGIIEVGTHHLEILPPGVEVLQHEVLRRRADLVHYWTEAGGESEELLEALHAALAGIGVSGAKRIAEAIASFGSKAYITPSGPVLELLTDLATAGDLEAFALAYQLFAIVRPPNAEFVRSSIPAKISSGYLASHRGLSPTKIVRWTNENAEWADELKSAIELPSRFVAHVEAIAENIGAHP